MLKDIRIYSGSSIIAIVALKSMVITNIRCLYACDHAVHKNKANYVILFLFATLINVHAEKWNSRAKNRNEETAVSRNKKNYKIE